MTSMIIRIILLLAPVVLFFLWLRYAKKKAAATEANDIIAIEQATREILWGVGMLAVITIGSIVILRMQESGDPSDVYVPPHTENGEIIPGNFE